MQFLSPSLIALLGAWMAAPEHYSRAQAHNVSFDEHVDGRRRDAFELAVSSPGDVLDLYKGFVEFYQLHVRTNSAPPHPFMALNSSASADHISGEQLLIRLEDLRDVLRRTGVTYDKLETALSDPGAKSFVDAFVYEWTSRPDIMKNPCAFAAFKDQLLDELEKPDWPDVLRDKLGLAHYDPVAGDIPVALMEYSVDQVRRRTTVSGPIAQHFAIPCIFDGVPNAHFFPTGSEFRFGSPMALNSISSEDELISELIHPRVSYESRNLLRVGLIKRRIPNEPIGALRNAHLWALRIATGRDSFGLEL